MLGVALRAEAGTAVIFRGCDFNKNVAKRHGTIFNRGTMTVEECNFSLNSGKVSWTRIIMLECKRYHTMKR